MNDRTPAILSASLTFVILLVAGLLLFLGQILVLNGVMEEGKAFTSIGIAIGSQCITLVLAATFAGWFSNLLIFRFDWNKGLAIVIAALLGTVLGFVVALILTVISFPLAGIQ